jgi:hypothetical protein
MLSPTHFIDNARADNPAFPWPLPTLEDQLSPQEAEQLLSGLVQDRWGRLVCEYDDPLGMLFNDKARQWTAGWAPDAATLYLIVWETASWSQKGLWRLYQNGQLVFEEPDGFSRERSEAFQKLLESPQLPVLSPAQLLERLTGFQYPPEDRDAALNAVTATVMTRPEIIPTLKEPLFQALETDLHVEEWPVLDILKVHCLSQKNSLLHLLQQLEHAKILNADEQSRLVQSLRVLDQQYRMLSPQLTLMFRPMLNTAHLQLLQTMASLSPKTLAAAQEAV